MANPIQDGSTDMDILMSYIENTVLTAATAGIGAVVALVAAAPIATTAALFAAFSAVSFVIDVPVIIFKNNNHPHAAYYTRTILKIVTLIALSYTLFSLGTLSAPVAIGMAVFVGGCIILKNAYQLGSVLLEQEAARLNLPN